MLCHHRRRVCWQRTWTGPSERSEGGNLTKDRAEESTISVCPDGIVIMSMDEPVACGSVAVR